MWELVRWLHLLAMALFVGGQIALVAVIVPVMRGRDEMRLMARRFGMASGVALLVLIVTGSMMAGHFGDWSRTELQVKLGLFGLMILLGAVHIRRPTWHALEGAVFLLTLAIVWLGVDLAHGF